MRSRDSEHVKNQAFRMRIDCLIPQMLPLNRPIYDTK